MRDGDSAGAKVARSIGIALLVVCLGVVALYMFGYTRPPHHPLPTSFGAVLSTLLEYLSLLVWPNVDVFTHWRLSGLTAVFLVAATLARLGRVGWRKPDERRRALAMGAVILAMLCAALAVAFSRSGLGPGMGRASRYVTTTAPLFCALYVAWLVYGSARARRFVHRGPARFDSYRSSREFQVWPQIRRCEADGLH